MGKRSERSALITLKLAYVAYCDRWTIYRSGVILRRFYTFGAAITWLEARARKCSEPITLRIKSLMKGYEDTEYALPIGGST